MKYKPPYQEDDSYSQMRPSEESDDYLIDHYSDSISSEGQAFVTQPKIPAKVTRKKTIKKQNSSTVAKQ